MKIRQGRSCSDSSLPEMVQRKLADWVCAGAVADQRFRHLWHHAIAILCTTAMGDSDSADGMRASACLDRGQVREPVFGSSLEERVGEAATQDGTEGRSSALARAARAYVV